MQKYAVVEVVEAGAISIHNFMVSDDEYNNNTRGERPVLTAWCHYTSLAGRFRTMGRRELARAPVRCEHWIAL